MILMNIIPTKIRKIWRLGFVFLLLCVIFPLWWRLRSTRGYKSAAGTYITTGGQSFLKIEPGSWGSLKVQEGFFILWKNDSTPPDLKPGYKDGRLILEQTENFAPPRIVDVFIGIFSSLMILEPSSSIPGDWDLIEAKITITENGPSLFRNKEFWEYITHVKSYDEFRRVLSKALHAVEDTSYDLDPAKIPLRSFLHRMNDPLVAPYFYTRMQNDSSSESLNMIRELSSRHPLDPYITLQRVEQEAIAGNCDAAFQLWKDWEAKNKASSNALLLKNAQKVERLISMIRMEKDHPDVVPYPEIFAPGKLRLEEIRRWLLAYLETDQIQFRKDSLVLVPPCLKPGYSPVPYFWEVQVHTKVLSTLALFDLFQGKREESLHVLTSLYRLGQTLDYGGYFIEKLVGIALRSIVSARLGIFVLNACENEKDFISCRDMLDRLQKTQSQYESISWYENSPQILLCFMTGSGHYWGHNVETIMRSRISDMKFELVRMALAAKYCLLKTGEFPGGDMDFRAFLPEGLPMDAFAKGTPLSFVRTSQDEIRVYSIGPDKNDDKASFEYDPTNGTVSSGDVSITIPREREFPFPREPVHAANAYELLAQFPNGLPGDTFGDERNRPFGILESMKDHPVTIFSFGPDTDEAEFTPYAGGTPGSLGEGFVPVPTPEPPPGASYGRSLQWVMRRSDKNPPPPGYWTPDPPYDPTNGTVSPGDLFLEIPR